MNITIEPAVGRSNEKHKDVPSIQVEVLFIHKSVLDLAVRAWIRAELQDLQRMCPSNG